MCKFNTKLIQPLSFILKHKTFTSKTQFQPQPINLFHHPIKPTYFLESFSTLQNFDFDNETLILKNVKNPKFEADVKLIMDIIKPSGGYVKNVKSPNFDVNFEVNFDVKNNLEKSGVSVSPELVNEVLSQVRNDWKPAVTFFRWAGEQSNYAHLYRQYNCVIAILGKMRRFDDAWMLIDEMRKGGKNGSESMVTAQTLLIMIRRYSAAHDVGNAVKTFYAYKQFGFRIGVDEFHDLLSALCKYKNVKEAEALLNRWERVYPLSTKSYNIVLNGWCNVVCSPREGKRVWWEMCNRRIARDVVSYSTVISCYSKCNEFKQVVKIFNEMKAERVSPDLKVYNGVIHAFCKAGMEKEACEIMKSMKEKGYFPNAITYNSIIMPLCKKGRVSDALKVFDEMLERGLMPTALTYHAFFRACRTSEEAFSILQKMNRMGFRPNHDTYTMLIRKFCRWGEFDNVWKLWDEMSSNGLDPDRSCYAALVNGLFLNRKLEEAYKYQEEMKSKGLLPEPEMEETLQAWMSAKEKTEASMMIELKTKCGDG